MANVRQSRLDSGVSLQGKVLKHVSVIPSSSGSDVSASFALQSWPSISHLDKTALCDSSSKWSQPRSRNQLFRLVFHLIARNAYLRHRVLHEVAKLATINEKSLRNILSLTLRPNRVNRVPRRGAYRQRPTTSARGLQTSAFPAIELCTWPDEIRPSRWRPTSSVFLQNVLFHAFAHTELAAFPEAVSLQNIVIDAFFKPS